LKKYLQIQIQEGCHENWHSMTSAEQGRFCNACQKTVIDFTSMTDAQLANYFKSVSENACGRFHNDQLGKQLPLPVSRIPWLTYFLKITIPAFLFSFKSEAQRIQRIAKMPETVLFAQKISEVKKEESKPELFSGSLVDEKGNPVPWASIIITGTRQGTISDSSGFFSLQVPRYSFLEISVLGYESKTVKVDEINNGGRIVIQFIRHQITMGIMVVVKSKKARKKKMFTEKAVTTTVNSITVFPNPLPLFSTLTIRWKEKISADQEIEIYTITGALIQKERVNVSGSMREWKFVPKIDMAGSYVLRIMDVKTKKVLTEQFIAGVQH
jgi:hypothetical protein